MRTKYQRAFDHVAASHRLKEEVRNMTKQERRALGIGGGRVGMTDPCGRGADD